MVKFAAAGRRPDMISNPTLASKSTYTRRISGRLTGRCLFYTLLLVVYAAFFSVQFFFNFNSVVNTPALCRIYSVLQNSPGGNAAISKTAPLKSSPLHTIRLNKRFQQEDMPPCTLASIVVPERYIPLRTPDYSKHIFTPSFVPDNNPLRGPPCPL
jgi:hypothetical protein